MKKILLTITAALTLGVAAAQEEMTAAWETKLEHRTNFATGFSQKRNYSYGCTEKEITLLDNATGQVKWTKKFNEISDKLRKIDELIPMWDANVLFLFDRKVGKDQIACIDAQNGNLLWVTDKYQDISEDNVVYISEMEAFALSLKASLVMIKARSGEEIWQTAKFKGAVGGYVYMNDGHLVMLNYKPGALAALFSGLKNQLVKINVKNGDVVWDVDYIGMVERKVYTREPVLKLDVKEGKIFLTLNGLQVYDYNTGTRIWSCAYDINLAEEVRKPAGAIRFGVYEAIADPLIVGKDVYIVDMVSRKKQYIKKYDLNSGKLLWTSPELENVKVAPNLYLSGDKLVLQVGGVVETQAYIKEVIRNTDGTQTIKYYYRKDYPTIKPCRLMGFSATDGKQLWDSERFKKGITNAIVKDGKVIACSGKALYNLNIEDGKENYEVELGDDNIGLAAKILEYKDRIVVVGEKGVSEHSPADGKFLMGARYKRSAMDALSDNILMMKTETEDYAAYDLETCKYKKVDARDGSKAYLSDDGTYVILFEKKTATRYVIK